ncbi:MAG: N-acetylmuramoyl-L-alanine amidase [Sedimentisphaerales bacterium]|nr:N-acetylmuramoyl-L-alanine amidase [Sedimentisphaerales bacterium]
MVINKLLSFKTPKPQKNISNLDFDISRRFFLKSLSACGVILISGCQTQPTRDPYIPKNYGGSDLIIPPPVDPIPQVEPVSDIPWNWYPPRGVEKNWTAIIVHHSATETGNMALFDREHKNKGWDGVGYDFVIGNGSDSGDGEVEVTFRWRQQITGAHCKTPDNWANIDGIGICLVGNFNNRRPTQRQMDALVKLTDFLQKRYRIPQSRITGHGETRGAHVTDCPGDLFPMVAFKSSLNF